MRSARATGRALSTLAVALALLAGLVTGGCASGPSYEPNPGVYDTYPPEWRDSIVRARGIVESRDARAAARFLDGLRTLAFERREIVPLGILVQELELLVLRDRGQLRDLVVREGQTAEEVLGNDYQSRAEALPGAPYYVLAARLASGREALSLLEKGREEDPRCVWVHYGIAWWSTRLRDFPRARAAVDAAFELDPGHLPTMRLHASLLAGAGESEAAIECLEAWLDRSFADPFTDPRRRAEARVDLASLLLATNQPERALARLSEVPEEGLFDQARAELVRAVALHDLGRSKDALAAAERARAILGDDPLPLVHEALLAQASGDLLEERRLWQLLLDEAEARAEGGGPGGAGSSVANDPGGTAEAGAATEGGEAQESDVDFDFGALLFELQARARLQRTAARAASLEAERASNADPR